MKKHAFTIVALLLLSSSVITSSESLPPATVSVSNRGRIARARNETPTSLPRLEVSGTKIQYTNGTQVWLKGVNIPWVIWRHKQRIDQAEMQYVGSWNCNWVVYTVKDDWQTISWIQDLLADMVEWAAQEGMYSVIQYKIGSGMSDLTDWTTQDWNNWISWWTDMANAYDGNTNVIYSPVTEPTGISASLYQQKVRECIDTVRAIHPDVMFMVHALDMYGGIGLWSEEDYPINRDNVFFCVHDHWWRAEKPTSKTSIRNKLTNLGVYWCLDNNRAVVNTDFNYDADIGTDGEIWLRNCIEVMNEDGFAGWAHWGWMTASDTDQDWSEITSYGSGNPTTQGSILQEYLPNDKYGG